MFLGMFLVAAITVAAILINHARPKTEVIALINDKGQMWVDDSLYCLPTEASRVRTDPETGIQYAQGEILVSYTDAVPKSQAEADAKAYGAELVGFIGSTGECQWRFEGEYSYEELRQKAENVTQTSQIAFATVNYISDLEADADSGYFYTEGNSGKNSSQESVMHLQEARRLFVNEVNRRGKVNAINVGVVDTYFVPSHNDLTFARLFYNVTMSEN